MNMNIDQIIMCAIYAISRKYRFDIKFGEIMDNYKEYNIYNRDIHDSLFKVISIDNKELNIIGYYNEYFINRLKQYVLNIKV